MSCPMSFGELNIPSSRAFWDDCDEDEPTKQTSERLQLTYADGVETAPIECELFLIIEGTNIADFAEKTLLIENTSKICNIPAKRSSLHKIPKGLIAILEEDLTSSGEVTELLLPYAKLAKNVITITIKAKVDYKSENVAKIREKIVFWRSINGKLNHIEELQPPNFIAGVAAGVASSRDNQKLSVSSYVAYVDNIALDSLVSEPILKILQQFGLVCAATYNPKLKDDSHLYS